MHNHTVVLLTIGILASGTLAYAQDWARTPASSWSPEQVTAFLDDSPWAGRASVRKEERLARWYPTHKAIVTWESASLVREVRGRLGQQALQRIDAPGEPTYRVSVRLWGTAKALEETVPQRTLDWTVLRRSGKPLLTATHVEMHLLKKDGTVAAPLPRRERLDQWGRIAWDACNNLIRSTPPSLGIGVGPIDLGGFPAPADGDWGVRHDLPCRTEAVFIFDFPASDPIAADEVVEFTSNLGRQTVSKTFQMHEMVVNGALNLR